MNKEAALRTLISKKGGLDSHQNESYHYHLITFLCLIRILFAFTMLIDQYFLIILIFDMQQLPSPRRKALEQVTSPIKNSIKQIDFNKIIAALFKVFKEPVAKKSPYDIKLSLHELLEIRPRDRSKKNINAIRNQMRSLQYFKKNPFANLRGVSRQLMQIAKRQNQIIIKLIAPFATVSHYWQGEIIETTATTRNIIRIVLQGQVHIFQPVNHKSFKNCLHKVKSNEYRMEKNIQRALQQERDFLAAKNVLENSDLTNDIITMSIGAFLIQQMEKSKQSSIEQENLLVKKLKRKISRVSVQDSQINATQGFLASIPQQEQVHYKISKDSLSKTLSILDCRNMLTECNIHNTFSTTHRHTKTARKGELIVTQDNPQFMQQKSLYYSTAICSTECLIIQVDYKVCTEIGLYLTNDEDKPYIRTLLMKFQYMEYQHARQYIMPQYKIEKHWHRQQDSQLALPSIKKLNPQDQQLDQQQKEKIKLNKEEVSSLKYEIAYTGQKYIIVEGQVTLQISKHFQTRFTLYQYATSKRHKICKQILKLYPGDLFGFEEIGKDQAYDLKYLVNSDSKLLILDQTVISAHCGMVFHFQRDIENIIKSRNQLISGMISKMQNSLQIEMISRHIKNKSTQLFVNSPRLSNTKEISYFGKKSFHQIHKQLFENQKEKNRQQVQVPSEAVQEIYAFNKKNKKLTQEIVRKIGLGLEFSSSIIVRGKDKISFEKGVITVRKQNGQLRRKSVISDKGFQRQEGRNSDKILRKIGLLNCEQMIDHNMECIIRNKGLGSVDDLKKQKKEFDRLKQKAQSVPKIPRMFAKKEDVLFRINHRKKQLF